ncbi:hypothetical protein OAU50_02435 [Planctomycetota bacterium]|nr:hypothetical protein [Planctomycetota bacterium]
MRVSMLNLGLLALFIAGCGNTYTYTYTTPDDDNDPVSSVQDQPEPEPAVLTENFDPSKPPASRPWIAPEREKINPANYKQPTFASLMNGEIAKWRDALEPAFIRGTPHAMKNVKTDGVWWNGTATLKVESIEPGDGSWKAQGYGEATYNSNGAIFAKGHFRDGKMHGPFTFYNEDGSLQAIRCYSSKTSNITGPFASFEDGKVVTQGQYNDGQQSGVWKYWRADTGLYALAEWQPMLVKAVKVWEKYYLASGYVYVSKTYKNGLEQYPYQSWHTPKTDDSGKVLNVSSVGRLELLIKDEDGKLHGWQTFYDRDKRNKTHDTWYEHGEQTGTYVKYHEDKSILQEGYVKDGIKQGKWREVNILVWGESTSNIYHYKDGTRHGPFEKHSLEGKLKEKGTYKDGNYNGIVESWYVLNGIEIHSTKTYLAGILDGPISSVDETGMVIETGTYDNGQNSGEWSYLVQTKHMFHSDAALLDENWTATGNYVNGSQNGAWKWTRPDGHAGATGQFKNNSRIGKWIIYHADGTTIRASIEHGNGSENVIASYFSDTGILECTLQYVSGMRRYVEEQQWFHENGQLQKKGSYTDSGWTPWKTGDWDEYDDSGALIKRTMYSSNVETARLERESELTDAPEGVAIDTKKINGIWLRFEPNKTTHSKRMRVVNNIPTGLYQEFFTDGKLFVTGEVRDGKRQGEWKVYYNTSTLKEQAVFIDSKKTGAYSKWRANESLETKGEYTADVKTGMWTTYATDGKQKLTEIFYNAEGKYGGSYKTWHANGQLKTEGNYKDHASEGLWTEWYEDGTKYIERYSVKGKAHGTNKTWYKNGQIHFDYNYTDGKLDGDCKVWHENGKLQHQRNYRQGKKIGHWKKWDENGELVSEENHDPKKPVIKPDDDEPKGKDKDKPKSNDNNPKGKDKSKNKPKDKVKPKDQDRPRRKERSGGKDKKND